jgi:ABC-type multidrug transport system ATPase subunit
VKKYGKVRAVNQLNLRVPKEQITAFLGRNGAGKSTTIKMLLGITRPSSAEGTVLGKAFETLDKIATFAAKLPTLRKTSSSTPRKP